MEEEGSQSTGYWCYECSRAVETIMEVETVKCSLCRGGFVEELDISNHHHHRDHHQAHASESDRSLSLWSPVLLGMLNNSSRTNRARRLRQIEPDNETGDDNNVSDLDNGWRPVNRRRRRSSTTILRLLQGTRPGLITGSDDNDDDNDNNNRGRDGERVIVLNHFNNRIMVQGAGGRGNPFGSRGPPQNQPIGALGDYFVGPDMELLLQHLAETSPARYGSPPAHRKAVETMQTVKISQDLNNLILCSVCLEDFEVGNEAKEMPCTHKFHGECIVTWLDLHSTCPVCRFQLPFDESKRERESSRGSPVNMLTGPGSESGESGENGDTVGRNERRFAVTFPWPFSSLFTSTSGSQVTNPNLIINPLVSPRSGSESGSGPTGQGGGGGIEDDH